MQPEPPCLIVRLCQVILDPAAFAVEFVVEFAIEFVVKFAVEFVVNIAVESAIESAVEIRLLSLQSASTVISRSFRWLCR